MEVPFEVVLEGGWKLPEVNGRTLPCIKSCHCDRKDLEYGCMISRVPGIKGHMSVIANRLDSVRWGMGDWLYDLMTILCGQ